MSNIASVANYIQVEASRFRSAVSESEAQTVGGSINYCLDRVANHEGRIVALESTTSSGPNVVKSSPSGLVSFTSSSFADIPNLSITFTKTKSNSMVRFSIESGPTVGQSYARVDVGVTGLLRFQRAGVNVNYQTIDSGPINADFISVPSSSCLNYIDTTAGVGPTTYKLQAAALNGSLGISFRLQDFILVAEEIKY